MPATVDLRQASISTTGYLDGLGRRSIRFDRELGVALECLHVRPELRAYEDALLAQACALAGVADADVVRIRSLEREHGRLVVISELPLGDRLLDILDARAGGAAPGIDAALGFLLKILPSLARLHSAGITHGAVAPGRVMIEPTGRVLLADAVFGTALPRLNLSGRRMWEELQIAFPAEHASPTTAADVAQAALCGVAIALGRPLDTYDLRQAPPSVIDQMVESARARGGAQLASDVRQLFEGLLPTSGIASSTTAVAAVEQLRGIADRELGSGECAAAFAAFVRYEAIWPPAAASVTVPASPSLASVLPADAIAELKAAAAGADVPDADEAPVATRSMFGAFGSSSDEQPRLAETLFDDAATGPKAWPWKIAAAAVLVLGIGLFAGRSYLLGDSGSVGSTALATPPPAAEPAPAEPAPAAPAAAKTGVLNVVSNPAGARVLVDGRPAGQTPLKLQNVEPGRRNVTIINAGVTTRRTVRVEAGKTAVIDLGTNNGWLVVQAPVALDVMQGGRKIGVSGQARIQLAPGRHSITLNNKGVGYSSQHTVEVAAGAEATVAVNPTGRVNLNASPWAEVWIDGARAGETPLANLQVPLGSREFVFRHPQFGERKLTATVSTNPTALSVDFTKSSQRP